MHYHASEIAFWPSVAMWIGMMAAMMAPTVWPWVLAFHRFGANAGASRIAATTEFSGGYLLAWTGYAVGAAMLQSSMPMAVWATPLVLAGAGLYQFAPLKRACLTHCRNPITYFVTRWSDRPARGFRVGFEHGLYCVGCCWALMAISLVVGMANLWWMAAIAAVTFVEQAVVHGDRLRIPLGIGLLAWSMTFM